MTDNQINKILKSIIAVLLVISINTAVNFSDNLYMGLRHPEIYLPIVVVGVICSIAIQLYGVHKLMEKYFYAKS